jgi:hypothetical protein
MEGWNEVELMPIIMTKVKDFNEYLSKNESDKEFRKAVSVFGNFYETLGVAVKAGFMNIRIVALMWAGDTRMFWENIVEPVIEDMRKHYNYPRYLSETEYVCRELIKYMDEHPELKT